MNMLGNCCRLFHIMEVLQFKIHVFVSTFVTYDFQNALMLQVEGAKYCFYKRDMYGFWPIKSCSKLHPAHLSAERGRRYKIVPPKSDDGSIQI